LQGLVGLQLLEALRLPWEKVDLNDQMITIDGEVKNRFRVRKIPIPAVAKWLLEEKSISSKGDALVINGYDDFKSYSKAIKRELKRWDESVDIKPKDLRNTIQTEAINGGWYDYILQRYVGHAPTTIGERHYYGDKGSMMITNFREKVVARIDRIVDDWNAPHDLHLIYKSEEIVQKKCTI
jgi:integrase